MKTRGLDTTEFLPTLEASSYLGVDPGTLRRRITRGDLAVHRDPLDDRRKLIRRTDLEALRRVRPAQREELAEISAA